jgi:hypothetical protein
MMGAYAPPSTTAGWLLGNPAPWGGPRTPTSTSSLLGLTTFYPSSHLLPYSALVALHCIASVRRGAWTYRRSLALVNPQPATHLQLLLSFSSSPLFTFFPLDHVLVIKESVQCLLLFSRLDRLPNLESFHSSALGRRRKILFGILRTVKGCEWTRHHHHQQSGKLSVIRNEHRGRTRRCWMAKKDNTDYHSLTRAVSPLPAAVPPALHSAGESFTALITIS